VNAPVIDYPGSAKRLLDRALVFEPMRRWREQICRRSDLIVTPHAAILPADTPRSKILEIEWGADTDRFRPGATGPVPFTRPADTVAVFAGAFRNWHGTIHIVTALRELRARGRTDIGAVFIGDGPELPHVRKAAAGLEGVIFAGALPHDRLPACLSACDIGVAPFDPDGHPADARRALQALRDAGATAVTCSVRAESAEHYCEQLERLTDIAADIEEKK